MDIQRFNSNGRFHEAVAHNGTLYLSGQVAAHPGSIREQAKECMDQLAATLEKYHSDKAHILSATVYLADLADFAAFNEIWDHWFEEGSQPVRTCVGAPLAAPQYLVEISLIAAQI